jgi:integrase/recombinase XerC
MLQDVDLVGLVDRWLLSCDSAHTVRAYQRALSEFQAFLFPTPVWLATSSHAAGWKQEMEAAGLAGTTINQRLAACSSFYAFLLRETVVVDGIERSLFVDAAGRERANPFRSGNASRARAGQRVRETRPLTNDELAAMRRACKRETRQGARDFALLECYLRTGRRLQEIQRLRWGDIHEDDFGNLTFDWVGKGKKAGRRAFPRLAYVAIVEYLMVDGRWQPNAMDPGMYIFRPLSTPAQMQHEGLDENRPINPGQVCRIIKKLAKQAGLPNWNEVHPHMIRHSVAYYLYEQTKDPRLVMELLDHSDLRSTIIYLDGMQAANDNFSDPLSRALGF